ncbi:MAG: 3-isopropylmalate dehydratase small subunit [Nanoarchaeota archaeon]|nr:3-isopropylmalate dehydratase small subunit [Nanoarchaeota archaeon]MBU1004428.1 3-isopropylmalate dehydratase small subunit [Nanoarchaeota archaeon]MBU1946685.1 3-isopropylmalate dehydratase small subunit [Nanoarchaeota archaeon]
MILKGKAHVYKKDHINTDEIIPARYLNMDKEADLAKFAMEDLDKTFIKKVKPGDFIVAGENFGCGSSREHAVWALRGSGVKAVIAGSFARIFFRNCINNGFYAIELKDASKNINDQDELEIDIESGTIKNLTTKKEFKFTPFPKFAIDIIKAGGLLNYIKKNK